MAHYRKVETKIWNDARFLSLSAHGKLAYLFILTHPHMTALGAMRTTIPGLTFELPDAPAKAFREVFAKGLAQADERACMVWLPKFLLYNVPESPNVVRSWTNAFDLLPDCELKVKLLYTMKAFTEGLSEGFGQAFREGFGDALTKASLKSSLKTYPNPEQEQEQDKETPLPPVGNRVPPRKSPDPEIMAAFDVFYTAYPRHVAKGAALRAWKTATKTTPPDTIIAALHKQIRARVFSDDVQYVKHPASWLNGQCWNDDVPQGYVAPDTRPTKFRVQPIIDPETGEELEAVRTLEYPTFDAMEAAMKSMQVDRKDDSAGYWLFTEAGYAQQIEAARHKRMFGGGLLRKI